MIIDYWVRLQDVPDAMPNIQNHHGFCRIQGEGLKDPR
jgi:hypothetical protein